MQLATVICPLLALAVVARITNAGDPDPNADAPPAPATYLHSPKPLSDSEKMRTWELIDDFFTPQQLTASEGIIREMGLGKRTFRIASYNVLCQVIFEKWLDIYEHITAESQFHKWDKRKKSMRHAIERLITVEGVKIVTLQEVHKDHRPFYVKLFADHGFLPTRFRKRVDKFWLRDDWEWTHPVDGCLTFYSRKDFDLLAEQTVIYQREGELKNSNNIGHIAVFRLKSVEGEEDSVASVICVANTHLVFGKNRQARETKVGLMKYLLGKMRKMVYCSDEIGALHHHQQADTDSIGHSPKPGGSTTAQHVEQGRHAPCDPEGDGIDDGFEECLIIHKDKAPRDLKRWFVVGHFVNGDLNSEKWLEVHEYVERKATVLDGRRAENFVRQMLGHSPGMPNAGRTNLAGRYLLEHEIEPPEDTLCELPPTDALHEIALKSVYGEPITENLELLPVSFYVTKTNNGDPDFIFCSVEKALIRPQRLLRMLTKKQAEATGGGMPRLDGEPSDHFYIATEVDVYVWSRAVPPA